MSLYYILWILDQRIMLLNRILQSPRSYMSNLSVACGTHIALPLWVFSVIGAELETLALLRIRSLCLCFGGWLTQCLYSDSTVLCTGARRELSSQSHHRPLDTHTRPHFPVVNCQGWCTTSDIIPRSNNKQMLEVTLAEQVLRLWTSVSIIIFSNLFALQLADCRWWMLCFSCL